MRLDRITILEALRTKHLGRSLLVLDECTSTNDVAEKFALEGAPEGFTVLAEEQIHGRGRHGRAWFSPRGGIWMTLILRPRAIVERFLGLQIIGALAIAQSASVIERIKAFVRWPNDVVVNGRKLGGVLIEIRFRGNSLDFALLGLGVNANFHTSQFGNSIDQKSTSLLDVTGSPIDRISFICSILAHTERLYGALLSDRATDVLEELRKFDCSRGKRVVVRLQDATLTGVIDDYETLTSVRIRLDGGSHAKLETSSVVSAEYACA